MAVPMYLLYEVGIVMSRIMLKKRAASEPAPE
jgi:Sec-independent protein secretion pathway component TatC